MNRELTNNEAPAKFLGENQLCPCLQFHRGIYQQVEVNYAKQQQKELKVRKQELRETEGTISCVLDSLGKKE